MFPGWIRVEKEVFDSDPNHLSLRQATTISRKNFLVMDLTPSTEDRLSRHRVKSPKTQTTHSGNISIVEATISKTTDSDTKTDTRSSTCSSKYPRNSKSFSSTVWYDASTPFSPYSHFYRWASYAGLTNYMKYALHKLTRNNASRMHSRRDLRRPVSSSKA